MKKFIVGPRMWVILLAALLVFGGLFAMQWYGSRMMNQSMDNQPRPTVTISATEAGTARWQPTVDTVATLASIRGAELATEIAGIVEAVHFENGATVAEGDVILDLRTAPDRAELEALEAAAELARLELQRASSLVNERNISEAELDRRAAELDQARAQAAAQRERIEQKKLRAPFAGALGIRRYNVGDYVVAGDTIVDLQALQRLYVNFTLPDRYSDRVREGMPVEVRVQALDGTLYPGVINAVAPSVDPDTRNFAVQATLDNPEQALKPGMFARLSLPLGEPQTQVIVPGTAVSYRPYGNFVYVVEDQGGQQTVSQRFVTLGANRGDMVAVLEGLEAGETVATSGLLKLGSGAPVRIDNSVTPTTEQQPTPANG
ncbi:efflux RND transporter periplasmic adaptor subunit [Kineobactrum salinum]|uniref:Efflux RND transporter periplasmic adaptor subunit n=1 Tax=Kineobactrum salinum TaxID=2708301 RepID=A0A6C0U093_9GAMM|nr:efflux RND transporter periplasmic adaptor subunit [Kineobactrum salinum]QIB65193.1 efflux RND transporter periplasmic adaptor subunit [Kineobactrum salinum]